MRMQSLVDDAQDELKSWIENNPDDDNPDEIIHEIADSNIPPYNFDLLHLAIDNLWLAVDTPENEANLTAIDFIKANIYEYIEEELFKYWDNERDNILENRVYQLETDI